MGRWLGEGGNMSECWSFVGVFAGGGDQDKMTQTSSHHLLTHSLTQLIFPSRLIPPPTFLTLANHTPPPLGRIEQEEVRGEREAVNTLSAQIVLRA